MNRNPLMPFGLIAVIGIIAIIAISFYGLNNADKIAKQESQAPVEEKAAAPAAATADDPEGMVKASCAGCHGQNLEGAVGPALNAIGGTLSAEEIASVIKDGKNSMPPGLVDDAKAEKIAAWLAEKK